MNSVRTQNGVNKSKKFRAREDIRTQDLEGKPGSKQEQQPESSGQNKSRS